MKMDIIIIGAGKMGRLLKETIEKQKDMNVVAIMNSKNISTMNTLDKKVHVVIDMSNTKSFSNVYNYVKKYRCAYVCGTTGYSDAQFQQLKELSNFAPVLYAPNFSIGVTVMKKVIQEISPALKDLFDVEIIEKYHRLKMEAPGGTALMLANSVNNEYEKVYGRQGLLETRKDEIGIHCVRGGTLAGEHTVLYLGEDEELEITHRASSKQIFVQGALLAIRFLNGKEQGYYQMEDVLFV